MKTNLAAIRIWIQDGLNFISSIVNKGNCSTKHNIIQCTWIKEECKIFSLKREIQNCPSNLKSRFQDNSGFIRVTYHSHKYKGNFGWKRVSWFLEIKRTIVTTKDATKGNQHLHEMHIKQAWHQYTVIYNNTQPAAKIFTNALINIHII